MSDPEHGDSNEIPPRDNSAKKPRRSRWAKVAIVLASVVALYLVAGLATTVYDRVSGNAGADAGDGLVVYEVTGDGTTASVTYTAFTEGTHHNDQISDAPLPFSEELTVAQGGNDGIMNFTVTAVADVGTSVTCTITLNGRVRAEQTSSDVCSASYLPDYEN